MGAKIYDFDRSYVERIGDNPILEGNICEISSQCNMFIPNKEFSFTFANDTQNKLVIDGLLWLGKND